LILYQIYGLLSITFEPVTLESQRLERLGLWTIVSFH